MPVRSPAAGGAPARACRTRKASAAAARVRTARRSGLPCRTRAETSVIARHGLTRGSAGTVGGGVAGGASAVFAVGVGGGGDGPPRGADLLVVQVRARGQAERGERVAGARHGRAEHVVEVTLRGLVRADCGRAGLGLGWGDDHGRSELGAGDGQRGGAGPGDLHPGAAARVDVAS
jgi:hypothetical protein